MKLDIADKVAKIVTERILTPVVYMLESDEKAELICFCDRNVKMQELYDAEVEAEKAAGKKIEIVDIREYDECERLEITNKAELIYSQHPMVEHLFMMSMLEDLHISADLKQKTLQRYRENGSCYLQ